MLISRVKATCGKDCSLILFSNKRKGKKRTCPVSEETKRKISASLKGKSVSDETRKKISTALTGHPALKNKPSPNKGKKIPKYIIKKQIKARCKSIYEITKPDGAIEITTNICEYSRNNGLDSSGMYKVINGKYKQYNGFKCKKIK